MLPFVRTADRVYNEGGLKAPALARERAMLDGIVMESSTTNTKKRLRRKYDPPCRGSEHGDYHNGILTVNEDGGRSLSRKPLRWTAAIITSAFI